MSHVSIWYTQRTGRRILALGGVLLGVGLALVSAGHHTAIPAAPVSAPRVDPRLVIRPRTIPVAAVLSGGLRLSGAYYPAYPGRNVLDLTVRGGNAPLARAAFIAVSATMPGMAMPPIRATLTANGHNYRGALSLPMFGAYRVAVAISAPHTRVTGTITVTLPLPGR